jgi:steroid delta-isomerase
MTDAEMVRAVELYAAALSGGDLDALLALFSQDATVEDPYGAPPRRGTADIGELFAGAVAVGLRIEIHGPVRTAADCAAFAFTATMANGAAIDAIDVFRFDAEGRIRESRAYWGALNLRAATPPPPPPSAR